MSYEPKIHKDAGGNREVFEPGAVLKLGNAVFTVDASGRVIVTGLPTTKPAVAGALYSNSGVLTISDGA